MLKGEVMADVVVEAFSMDDRPVMLGLSKWMCWPDVSMGAGERPRRGEPSCWSAMVAKRWRLSYCHVRSCGDGSERGALSAMRLLLEVNKDSPQVMSITSASGAD